MLIRGIAETRQLKKIWWQQSSWGYLRGDRQSHSSRSHLKSFTGHAEQLHWLHFPEKCVGDSREAECFHLHHIWQQPFQGVSSKGCLGKGCVLFHAFCSKIPKQQPQSQQSARNLQVLHTWSKFHATYLSTPTTLSLLQSCLAAQSSDRGMPLVWQPDHAQQHWSYEL